MASYRFKNFQGVIELSAKNDPSDLFSWASNNLEDSQEDSLQPLHGTFLCNTYRHLGYRKEDFMRYKRRYGLDRSAGPLDDIVEEYRVVRIRERIGRDSSLACYVFEDGRVYVLHDSHDILSIKAYVFSPKFKWFEAPLVIGSIANEKRYLRMLKTGVFLADNKATGF